MDQHIFDRGQEFGWKSIPAAHPDVVLNLTKRDVNVLYFKSGTMTVQGKNLQETYKHVSESEVNEVLSKDYALPPTTKKNKPSYHQPRHVKTGSERGSYAHSFMKVLMQLDEDEKMDYDELADEAVAAADALLHRLSSDPR